jgi:glutamyl-tRNA reductase
MHRIISAHVTHKQVSVDQLERISEKDASELMRSVSIIPGVKECAVLKTCNRVELYVVADDPIGSRKGLEDLINGLVPFGDAENLVLYQSGPDSVRHLLRVSSGLESMILGEDQVQSQVKEAFDTAVKGGFIGPVLSIVFRKAINVGKKVRSQTKVNKGCVSIGSASVELAEARLGSLEGKNILIIGAGEMATLIAKHLVGKGPKAVFVSNRTYSRAVELAWALGGKAVRFDSLIEFLVQADVVLCATSATHIILNKKHAQEAMALRDSPMFIIDVSMPRNVSPDVSEVPGVELHDIDGLRGVAEENILRRKNEILNAELIIASELDSLDERMREMRADEVLSRIYIKINAIKEREVQKALQRARSGTDMQNVLEDFANALTNKFLADPTAMVKEASREGDEGLLKLTKELFRLEGEEIVPAEQAEKIANASRH